MNELELMSKRLARAALMQEQGGSGYFTRDQVDELQSMLGLDDHETASMIAEAITDVLAKCERLVEARKQVPPDGDAKERLRKIALHAKQLERLLSQEPAIQSLLSRPKRSGDRKGMRISEIREIGRRPKEILENLRILAAQAPLQAEDDSEFARVRELLPNVNTKNPEVLVATRILWPELFELWADLGKPLAWTDNGPTYRFIELVHTVADLPPPKQSTLRDAIRAWKTTAGDHEQSADHGGR
jgi:hypothetical protein